MTIIDLMQGQGSGNLKGLSTLKLKEMQELLESSHDIL